MRPSKPIGLLGTAAVAAVVAAAPVRAPAGPDVSAGLSLTIEAPSSYSAGVPVFVTGRLLAVVGLPVVLEVSRGVRDQPIDVLVDERVEATARTNSEGIYSIDLRFDAQPPTTRSIRAVAFRGTPAETPSRTVQASLDRRLIELVIEPAEATLAPGGTVGLRAMGTYDDGRRSDVTSIATWVSSDDDVATVSDDPADRGVVTGVAPGSAEIAAMLEGTTAVARVTVA